MDLTTNNEENEGLRIGFRHVVLGFVVGALAGFGLGVELPAPKPKPKVMYDSLAELLSDRGAVRVVARVGYSWTLVDSTGRVVELYEQGTASWKAGEVIEAVRP